MTSEIYQVLYTALVNAGLSVFDRVPQDEDAYPYVKLQAIDTDPWDTDDDTGFNGFANVHVFSRYEGSKEVEEQQKIVYDALHRQSFANTASYEIIGVDQQNSSILMDPDGKTMHGIQQIRIIFEEI